MPPRAVKRRRLSKTKEFWTTDRRRSSTDSSVGGDTKAEGGVKRPRPVIQVNIRIGVQFKSSGSVKLELAFLAVIRRIRGREGWQQPHPDRGELGHERKGGRGRGILGGGNLVGGGRRR